MTGGRRRQTAGWSGLAIAAFVTACIPWIGILAAVPLGIVALVKIGKSRQRGKGLAIAGIVISALIWVATIGIGVAVYNNTASRDSQRRYHRGRPDQLRRHPHRRLCPDRRDQLRQVRRSARRAGVPCSAQDIMPSRSATSSSVLTAYPGYTALTEQARVQCTQLASQYVDPSQVAGLQPYLFAPSQSLWDSDDGAHRVVCLVTKDDYSSMTGSVAR